MNINSMERRTMTQNGIFFSKSENISSVIQN